MAYHEPSYGHTLPIVGRTYTDSLKYVYRYKLKAYNPATGLCCLTSDGGPPVYVSESELSKWYMLSEDALR
jgi:hypothetical protein